ncbi:MAG: hypothetical protein AB3N24_21960 [Leisingera sp.]
MDCGNTRALIPEPGLAARRAPQHSHLTPSSKKERRMRLTILLTALLALAACDVPLIPLI